MRAPAFFMAVLLALACFLPSAAAQESLRLYHVVDIVQGGNASVMAGVMISEEATLPVSVSMTCCAADAPATVMVRPGKDNLFTVKIHAPLKQEPGYYSLIVRAGGAEESVGVSVGASDLVQRLPGLARYADSVQALVEGYEAEGVRMDEVKAMLGSADAMLSGARAAIEADDAGGLYESLFSVEKKLYYEVPLAISYAKSGAMLYNMIWIPLVVIVAGISLVLLRIKT